MWQGHPYEPFVPRALDCGRAAQRSYRFSSRLLGRGITLTSTYPRPVPKWQRAAALSKRFASPYPSPVPFQIHPSIVVPIASPRSPRETSFCFRDGVASQHSTAD